MNEGESVGPMGIFSKDAAIVCGGKNEFDNTNKCYKFNTNVLLICVNIVFQFSYQCNCSFFHLGSVVYSGILRLINQ